MGQHKQKCHLCEREPGDQHLDACPRSVAKQWQLKKLILSLSKPRRVL